MSETPDIIGMLQNSPYAYEQRRLNFAIDGSKKKVFSTSDDKINFLVLLGPVQGSARLHGDEPFFWGEGLSDDSKIKKFLEIKNSSLELIYETPQKIEKMNENLPVLDEFIIPGGTEFSARLHLVRTECRYVERIFVAVSQTETVPEFHLSFLNRLSDYLFVLARVVQSKDGKQEKMWQNKK